MDRRGRRTCEIKPLWMEVIYRRLMPLIMGVLIISHSLAFVKKFCMQEMRQIWACFCVIYRSAIFRNINLI